MIINLIFFEIIKLFIYNSMDKNKPIDLLSFIHFIHFYILGTYLKDSYIFAFGIAIGWEILEYYIVHWKYTRNLLEKYWPIPKKYWDEEHRLNPVFDIFFDMIGYHIGNIKKN